MLQADVPWSRPRRIVLGRAQKLGNVKKYPFLLDPGKVRMGVSALT